MIEAIAAIQNLLPPHATLPVAGGAFAGLAFAFLCLPLKPFGENDAQSLMNFSSLGSLRCICGTNHPERVHPDRREFCRACGCEVVQADRDSLERVVSTSEARRLTRDLRQAALRAGRLELPDSITSIAELQTYLVDGAAKLPRQDKTRLTAPVEQPQVRS